VDDIKIPLGGYAIDCADMGRSSAAPVQDLAARDGEHPAKLGRSVLRPYMILPKVRFFLLNASFR
jgi:hypothetical protein